MKSVTMNSNVKLSNFDVESSPTIFATISDVDVRPYDSSGVQARVPGFILSNFKGHEVFFRYLKLNPKSSSLKIFVCNRYAREFPDNTEYVFVNVFVVRQESEEREERWVVVEGLPQAEMSIV